jgi:hypothetical protein
MGFPVAAPSAVSPGSQPNQLLSQIAATLRLHVDLPDQDVYLISRFVLSTWIPERLLVAPYLWLAGPLGSGKTTLLKLLQALCRRAFLVSDLKPAALYQLPGLLEPTLLIDESDLSDSEMSCEFQRLLRIGNTRGATVVRNGRAYDCYFIKVLSSREPPSDAALASRVILIGMSPTSRQISPLDETAQECIATEFQLKLLMFRLHNFNRVGVSKRFPLITQGLTPRMKDLASALAAPLLGEAELEDDLVSMLDQQDRDARMQRALEPEWLVAEALFALCHPGPTSEGYCPKRISVLVGGIANIINEQMKRRGEDITMSAKKTGLVLRSLGIRTKSLGNLGRGIVTTPATRTGIHRVAQKLGISRRNLLPITGIELEYGGAPCALCEKFRLTSGLKFVELTEQGRQLVTGKDGLKLHRK